MSAFRPLRSLTSVALALAVAASLSGCITVFPKVKPAGLYRFGDHVAAAMVDAKPSAGPPLSVARAPIAFTRAAAGDQLLTVTGPDVAYVAGARWVSPASVLFDEAVSRAFGAGGGVRLIGRGESAKADVVLRLEVRSFETDYVNGAGAPPEVLVQVRAVMTRVGDRALLGDKIFEAKVPAADNRLGPIVGAYDQAVAKVLADTVAWVAAAKVP